MDVALETVKVRRSCVKVTQPQTRRALSIIVNLFEYEIAGVFTVTDNNNQTDPKLHTLSANNCYLSSQHLHLSIQQIVQIRYLQAVLFVLISFKIDCQFGLEFALNFVWNSSFCGVGVTNWFLLIRFSTFSNLLILWVTFPSQFDDQTIFYNKVKFKCHAELEGHEGWSAHSKLSITRLVGGNNFHTAFVFNHRIGVTVEKTRHKRSVIVQKMEDRDTPRINFHYVNLLFFHSTCTMEYLLCSSNQLLHWYVCFAW